MQAAPPTDWATREDFALLDGAPAFSVGSGAQAVTFWQSMVASTPELAARSAEDCERRWAELKPADDAAARVGPQPAVLEEWSRMADGRISGRIAGQPSAVWLTVALEGRLASDPRDEPGYIEAVGAAGGVLPRPFLRGQHFLRCGANGLQRRRPDTQAARAGRRWWS